MQSVKLQHFQRAVEDIGAHGDNDMLPFDIDNRFIADCKDDLASLAFDLFQSLENDGKKMRRKD